MRLCHVKLNDQVTIFLAAKVKIVKHMLRINTSFLIVTLCLKCLLEHAVKVLKQKCNIILPCILKNLTAGLSSYSPALPNCFSSENKSGIS